MKKTIAATLAAMLVMTMVACGENDTTDAEQATNSDNQTDSQEYAGGDSDNGEDGTPIASGLSGSCDGDSELMPSARLETTGQYLGISIDGYDKVKDLAASQFYAYTFLIKNPGDDGTWYQINLADYLATEGTKREITNLKTNESNTYPGWTTSDDQPVFETNIPDTMIHQKEGNLTWTLALTVDGEEMALCPADGDADLK
ncbi:hypothetical protein [Bifidobacterium pseudocatenulatum]|uniref:hypothetical protein n=1 Tax=Bifidobacterium pseudocatenulatum TaxID=28026 RepID=UPI00080B6D59|nr:hypothetical protein [Bifidobacterium pseudocatenulatum]GDZ03670.1 hypothetical protein MCC01992_09690 [Bifidobacteriaceae bacterium MCC01992]MCB4871643.1 hypothetical protein [Bifidobacterium pseudocatenulatum]MCB4878701.1 hypothetical protein [Bifidobacterium pseudocatenulatum]MCB4890557.1 hypothetical protein [Bifidobacterium pseudocatenulatum]MCB4909230.1 hypothetical protein [Bifidobacterium pseudocatenulatum]